jgi:hypothetical protein
MAAEGSEPPSTGLVFRENKFSAEPSLPFGTLAMPAFDQLDPAHSYVDVEANHFLCECDRLAWFIGAMTHGYERDAIAAISGGNGKGKSRPAVGSGSLQFVTKLYETAGKCLSCGLRKCDVGEQDFLAYARDALSVVDGQLQCAASGQPINKNQQPKDGSAAASDSNVSQKDPGTPNSYHYERKDSDRSSRDGHPPQADLHEEDLAEVRNRDVSAASTHSLAVTTLLLGFMLAARQRLLM